MNEWLCVTTLVENTVVGRGLRGEHGLAYYLRSGRHCLLFDTGQSDLLAHNARELGLALDAVGAIALSHGHYDHTGGIPTACALAPAARVFLHPAAVAPKFAGNPDGTARSVGMPESSQRVVWGGGERVTWTSKATEVMDGVFLTGAIPRVTDYEDVGGRFYLDAGCSCPDPLEDDQALYFDTAEGVVILLGCAHAGVVNTLLHARELTGGRPVHAVLGGMHLLEADVRRVERTFSMFRELGVRCLGPAHCTGVMPTARLRTEFAERAVVCAVGSTLRFRRA